MGPTSVAPGEIPHLKNDIYYVIAYNSLKDKHRAFGYYITLESAQQALNNTWKNTENRFYDNFFIEKYHNNHRHYGEMVEYYEVQNKERNLIKKDIPNFFKAVKNWALD